MKKQLFLLTVIISIAASSQAQMAQQASFQTSVQVETILSGSTILPKVAKNFYTAYPNATDAGWAKTNTGYLVRFTVNGIDHTVFLDKNGNKEGEIKYYNESGLNSTVRKLVKGTYFDYAVKSVKEITVGHDVAYFITIEDATNWKVIHLVDGEMEISEDHQKG